MGMEDRDGVIWFDGQFVPWRDAKIHVLTHSLHYGMGVFEGIRAYETTKGTAIFRLREHTQRLLGSAKILGIDIGYSEQQLNEAVIGAVRENKLSSAYIRPLSFYGSEGMGLHAENLGVHTIVAAWHWGAYLGADGMERGIRIKTSSYTRHHPNITMVRAKSSGAYMNSMLALQEVTRGGYDEALMLDVHGHVAEGSGENFFIVRNGTLFTPDLTSALEGITRDTVIQIAREIGLEVREKRITRDEVYLADEAFFTGTAAEVTPIRELDDRAIGGGSRGPITERLQSLFFDTVKGRRDNHPEWLTYVK